MQPTGVYTAGIQSSWRFNTGRSEVERNVLAPAQRWTSAVAAYYLDPTIRCQPAVSSS